jgi:hypothetical protein
MPWQQHAADIAGEVLPNGKLAYSEVGITVPRQSGKTTLILSNVAGRAQAGRHFGGRQTMLYAAQTREDARKKWIKEYLEDLRAAEVLRGRLKIRVANGSEEVMFTDSRSTFGPIATKETSGHGQVLDAGYLDEAFAQVDDSVPDAWEPAMITRPMAQWWWLSTMGTYEHEWFWGKVLEGRAAAELDAGTGLAYIEYSADESRTDYGNPDLWRSCMPAIGYTQSIESIRGRYTKAVAAGKLNGFRRAYLNQRTDPAETSVLPMEQWSGPCLADLADPDAKRVTRPLIALDVSADRAWGTLAFGFARADGLVGVRVVKHAEGTSWMAPLADELQRQYDSSMVVLDAVGPVRSLKTELDDLYVRYHELTTTEMVAACGGFYDAVVDGRLRHFGEEPLQLAVQGAETRELGDAWAWTRKRSTRADISPLVAVTCAHWAQLTYGDKPGYDMGSTFG